MHLARAPRLVYLLTLTLYVDLCLLSVEKAGSPVLAVNLTRDSFDFEVALPWFCCTRYGHAVSRPYSVFCDAQCTVLAYTNVLLVLEVLKS